ncbi:MAG: ABC transporter permease [Planctomycetes bacterium]|nr:ABC transporter permease [Planctomycetota bacterium]
MRQILAIIEKELKTISRDPVGLVMLFILPAFFVVTLSVALQGAFSSGNTKERMNILVINKDNGEVGKNIIEALEDTGIFRIVAGVDKKNLSKKEVKREIEKGNYRLAIVIPRQSTQAAAFEEDIKIDILVDPILPSEFAYIVRSAIQGVVYTSIIGGLLEKEHIVEKKYKEQITILTKNTGMGEEETSKIDNDDYPYFTQSTNYLGERGLQVDHAYVMNDKKASVPNSVQQSVPGWTIFALFWITQLLAINIVNERASGSYKRIMVSPVTMTQYIAGKTFPYLVINIIQAVFMFGIGIFILPHLGCNRIEIGNYTALALMTVAISFVSNGFGILIASVSRSYSFAATISAALLIIMCVLGGIMVPKFVMPSFMQQLSLFVPQGWAMDGYQNIIVKGYDTVEVSSCIGALLLFGAVFFTIGIAKMKMTEKQ